MSPVWPGSTAAGGWISGTSGTGTTRTVTERLTWAPEASLSVSVYVVVSRGWTGTGRSSMTGPTPWSISATPLAKSAVRVVLSPAVIRVSAAVKLLMRGPGRVGWV